MRTVTGKYGTAKIFTDLVDVSAINQVRTLMNQESVNGCKVRIKDAPLLLQWRLEIKFVQI